MVVYNFNYSDLPTDSLQMDLHLEGSAPITLLVRDESRSTKSSGARGSHCARTSTAVKQVSWGSTSSLANNDQVSVLPPQHKHLVYLYKASMF